MAHQAEPDLPVEYDRLAAPRIAFGAGQGCRDRIAHDGVGAQGVLGAATGAAQPCGRQPDPNHTSLHPSAAAVVSAYQAAASFASALRVSAGALTGLTTMPGSDSWYWPSITR